MKVKLFSHTDLDGIGCNIVLKSVIPKFDLDCENLNYNTINERVKEFFISGEFEEYIEVFITDISVNEEVAKIIQEKINETGISVTLLDHHKTVLWLNEYEWATVAPDREYGDKNCGTMMLYNELMSKIRMGVNYNIPKKQNLLDFVEAVRKYDTWEWHDKYHDDTPKKLNDLFFILGSKRFINEVMDKIIISGCDTELFIYMYSLLLELQQEKIDKYIEKKNKEIIEYNIQGYKMGVVFAEQFISELGNKLSEMNPQLDLIAMIGDNRISYRCVKEGVDCGEIAKKLGGGGHFAAAGSPISTESKKEYIERLFRNE